jgi:hypothetical protein
MCKIFDTRRNCKTGTVFIHVEDEEGIGIKKLSVNNFNYAKSFKNSDFLNAVSSQTDDRDMENSYYAEFFIDPDVEYSDY